MHPSLRWVFGFALMLGAACARSSAPPPLDAPMPVMPEVRPHNGVVAMTLDAVVDPSTKAPAFAYRGAVGVAPTIHIAPGDEIRVSLHNRLPAGTEIPNDVNLHFHGLTVSPQPPSDDAMRFAPPGGSISYDVRVGRGQPPGLYWYHPHVHEEAYWQVTSGMAGAIVVDGLERRLPWLSGLRQRVIILRNVQTVPDYSTIPIAARVESIRAAVIAGRRRAGRFSTVDDDDAVGMPCAPNPGMRVTVNGASHAEIGIDPGERQLFRVVNASAGRYFDLAIDGQPLDVVALDGVSVGAYPGSAAVERVQHLVLAPAARAEFVVTGGSAPATLRSNCFVSGEAGDRDPPAVLALLRPDGRAPAMSAASNDPATMSAMRAAAQRPAPLPAQRRTITFTEDDAGFYINAKRYRMGDPPAIVARSGTVERWTLVNRTDEVHDFHIHQVHFAVESIDGVKNAPMHWVDTVTVPPQRFTHTSSTPGSATILVDFRNPVVRGTFLFHCHILDHEDGGMMAAVTVR